LLDTGEGAVDGLKTGMSATSEDTQSALLLCHIASASARVEQARPSIGRRARSAFQSIPFHAASRGILTGVRRVPLIVLLLLSLLGIGQAAPLRHSVPVDFTRLGTRPVSMGGAFVAFGPDEQGVFHNPATLARHKLPRFGTSHSARHFPGPHERDQLDADPTALIWPMTPMFTIGQGWVTQGELGYAHHDLSDPAFPKQHFWGTERVEALAWDLVVLQAGVSHRTQSYRYADAAACEAATEMPALTNPSQTEMGEGTTVGILARVFPGVDYGWCQQTLEQDLILADDSALGVTKTIESSGWAIHPAGWLTITRQIDHPRFRTLKNGVKDKTKSPPVHRLGVECWLGPWLAVRGGQVNEKRSWGATVALPFLPAIHYGEVEDLMMDLSIQDWPDKYADTHHYSWSLGL